MNAVPERPQAVAFDVVETLFSLEPVRKRLQGLGAPVCCPERQARPWNRDLGNGVSLTAMLALSHRRFRRAVSPYADDELDTRAAQILADHLRDCDGCSHDLAMVLAIRDSLRRLAAAEPPTLAATRLLRWAANLEG